MPTENELEMLRAARTAGITNRDEMANFMGQMSHESGGFPASVSLRSGWLSMKRYNFWSKSAAMNREQCKRHYTDTWQRTLKHS